MRTNRILQRGTAVAVTAAIFAVVLPFSGLDGSYHVARTLPTWQNGLVMPPQWPMLGGSPSRNMANPLERNLPIEWGDEDGKLKNIKWMAELGSKALGGPVIAGGRVFVSTNNQNPRDKKFIGNVFGRNGPIDLGVVMCFNEADGKFLWQAIHHKLPGGQVIDWPREGIASTPTVETDRLYYVSNRCELVCADVKTGQSIWILDMIRELGVFPHNLANCSPLVVDETVYVVTSNGVNEDHLSIPAPQAPSFLAVNKRTGKVRWQNKTPTAKWVGANAANRPGLFKELVNRGELLMHSQWSNPAYGVVHGGKTPPNPFLRVTALF